MPKIIVSHRTHERMEEASLTADKTNATILPDGRVTFFIDDVTLKALQELDPDIERALNMILDRFFLPKTRQ